MHRRQPRSTLFPYTTLFRSGDEGFLRQVFALAQIACGVVGDRANEILVALNDLAERVAVAGDAGSDEVRIVQGDRKSTRLNSSHTVISYAVFCLKKKKPLAHAALLALAVAFLLTIYMMFIVTQLSGFMTQPGVALRLATGTRV